MKIHQAGALLCLGLMSADPVPAQEQVDLDEIRQQMEQLRKDYEAQLKALEKRLEKAEAQAEQNRTELAEKEARPAHSNALQVAWPTALSTRPSR